MSDVASSDIELRLPVEVTGDELGPAAALVREYYATSRAWPFWTGAWFERFDGGGDRPGVRDRITAADLQAVTFLSVRIPPAAAKAIEARQDEIGPLLAQIPTGVDLAIAAPALVERGSPAWRMWALLNSLPGIGWVTANKLLARKRPQLVPVYDRVVRDVLGRPARLWVPLQVALAADDLRLHRRLLDIRELANVGPDVSALRVLDVVCWRVGSRRSSLAAADDVDVIPAYEPARPDEDGVEP